jgi:predicted AlkP superfamily pyrophosphatase or phosphodiesterase
VRATLARGRAVGSALLAALLLAPPAPAFAQGDVSPVPLDAFGRGVERTASDERAGAKPEAPRLVVALLFDQYRDDYLDRFRPVFGKDGFRRLLDGGTRFRDCTIPYAATLTGPGHATWLSGASPAVHGIVGNDWYDRARGEVVAAAGDTSVRSVGLPPGLRGEPASPRWMRAQTVADVLRATTAGTAKVVGISDKARGAILPAGRRPNGAYWLDEESGLMQTSTYYATALPQWAVEANEARRTAIEQARRVPWTRSLPDAAYLGAVSIDAVDVFPHAVSGSGADAGRAPSDIALTYHPVLLTTLFDFAEAAIDHEGLGKDSTPDLLVLSVSITDRVGHRYGPDSPEVLDLAHRVDERLAKFLRHLDVAVGRGRWSLSVTSDHGVVSAAAVARRFEVAPGDSAGSLPNARTSAWVSDVLRRALPKAGFADAARIDSFALSVGSGIVTFNDAKLRAARVTRAQAARVIADSAAATPWYLGAFTADDVRAAHAGDDLAMQVRRTFYPDRMGDVVLVPRPYVFFGSGRTLRTNHGSPYRYDTHVPLLFYGWGVRAGSSWKPVSTVDIAPTVAALLGVDAPAQSEGRALDEAFAAPRAGGR